MAEKKYTYKIGEAEYFLSRMIAEQNNPVHFRYHLSAFLAAARTVLQYARAETRGTSNQQWYDDQIKAAAILGYLTNKRGENTHVRPLTLNQGVTVTVKTQVAIAEAVGVTKLQEGKVEEVSSSLPGPQNPIEDNIEPASIAYQYFFPDRPNEDLLPLCKQYIEKIKEVVNDGISKGILTDT